MSTSIAGVDATFERECGELAAAERRNREASDAEDAAALAVCAQPCVTIEEARRKAAYIATIPSVTDFSEDLTQAFIASFAEVAA